MPKRDKQHEEESPKESTTKYEGGQGSKTREQQAKNNSAKLHDADAAPADEQAAVRHDHKTRHDGGARLKEGRQQHDPAEKNSEANREDERTRGA